MIASPLMFKTGIDMSEDARNQLIELLNQQLADGFDLYSHTKQAHWNVKGKDFYQLHLLFDELAQGLLEKIDIIAERATSLGGLAQGTVHLAASGSRLPQFAADLHKEDDLLDTLIKHYSDYATTTRTAIDTALDLNDQDTGDLFIEVSRLIDKDLWFLQAHHQG